MARSDLLLSLVRAGSRGDASTFRKAVEALVAEERAKQHNVLADRLAEYLRDNGTPLNGKMFSANGVATRYLEEAVPSRPVSELILAESVLKTVNELIEEQQRADLLRSHGIEPRHRLLLVGPPGNGKTSLAESIAHSLALPLLRIRYDAVIGSYLGETASRLRHVFDEVRGRHCVLFFDEFDTIGKERGDPHDTGEVKRVVSSLLLQIDQLPSYVVVVTATNHPELLDRAVWRRFQIRIELAPPTAAQRKEWFTRFEAAAPLTLSPRPEQLAKTLEPASFSDLENFTADILRRWILTQPNPDVAGIVKDRIEQWKQRVQASKTS